MRRAAFWMSVAVVFTLPFENVVSVPGLGSVSRAVGLATAGVWALAVLGSGSLRTPRPPLMVALLFALWNGLSVLWSVNPGVSVGRFFTFVQLFLMVYILWDTARTRADVRIVQQAYVLGVWVTVLSLLRQYLVYGGTQYQLRFTVGSFQFNDIALVLAMGVPIAWYLGTNPGEGRARHAWQVVNLANVPAGVVGIMFSGSRAGMVALIPTIVYMIVTLMRLTPVWRYVAGISVVGLFLLLLPLVPPATIQRLTSTSADKSQGDLDGRTELWSQAYLTFKQHLFTGVGTGAFREQSSWKVAHDVWLRFAAELGLVGLSLFLLMIGMLLLYAWRQRPAVRGFCLAILVGWMISATFYNADDRKQTWLVFALVTLVCSSAMEPSPSDPGTGIGAAPTPQPLLDLPPLIMQPR